MSVRSIVYTALGMMAGLIFPLECAGAATGTAFVKALYQRAAAEQVALSPDGRQIAYTHEANGRTWVHIVGVDPPHPRKAWPLVDVESPGVTRRSVGAKALFIAWGKGERLVVQANTPEIFIIDLATKGIRQAVDEQSVATSFTLDAALLVQLGGRRNAEDPEVVDFDARMARQLAQATDGAAQGNSLDVVAQQAAIAAVNDEILDYAEQSESMRDGDGRPDVERMKDAMDRPRLIPRIPVALGLLPEGEHLLVAALGHPPRVPNALYKVNLATGKVVVTQEYDFSGSLLWDAEGRPALACASSDAGAKRTFLRPAASGGGARWVQVGNADTPEFSTTADNYFRERSMILALDGGPSRALVASNVGRETFALFTMDLATGRRTGPLVEDALHDVVSLEASLPHPSVILDRSSRRALGVRQETATSRTWWLDAGFEAQQKKLEEQFAGRRVELIDWSDDRTRFLCRITGPRDAGRIFVHDVKDQLSYEMIRCAPALQIRDVLPGRALSFATKPGIRVSGTIVSPRASRLNPPPLLIYLGDDLFRSSAEELERELQVFAATGFLAARINYRGSAGRGRQFLESVQAGFDRVPTEDIMAALDAIGRDYAFDRRRVALVGEGFGGYVALRALQLQPALFRCAVSINAPMDLRSWASPAASAIAVGEIVSPEITRGRSPGGAGIVTLPSPPLDFLAEARRRFIAGSAVPLGDISVLRDPASLTKPVLLLADPNDARVNLHDTRALRDHLKRLKRVQEYREIDGGYARGVAESRARAFREIEQFFNLHLYDYRVDIGPSKEVK